MPEERMIYHCLDCGFTFSTKSAAVDGLRCPACVDGRLAPGCGFPCSLQALPRLSRAQVVRGLTRRDLVELIRRYSGEAAYIGIDLASGPDHTAVIRQGSAGP